MDFLYEILSIVQDFLYVYREPEAATIVGFVSDAIATFIGYIPMPF